MQKIIAFLHVFILLLVVYLFDNYSNSAVCANAYFFQTSFLNLDRKNYANLEILLIVLKSPCQNTETMI